MEHVGVHCWNFRGELNFHDALLYLFYDEFGLFFEVFGSWYGAFFSESGPVRHFCLANFEGCSPVSDFRLYQVSCHFPQFLESRPLHLG